MNLGAERFPRNAVSGVPTRGHSYDVSYASTMSKR
jgi:hypothetical protein